MRGAAQRGASSCHGAVTQRGGRRRHLLGLGLAGRLSAHGAGYGGRPRFSKYVPDAAELAQTEELPHSRYGPGRLHTHLLERAALIVALHVATGAAAGAASKSRLAALLLGPVLHLAGDCLPHEDFHSTRLEIGTGLAGILLLAARRGPLDPATLGAAASSAPDLEHILPFLRPGRRKLFHDRLGWHREGPFPAYVQLLLAGGILAALVAPRR
jgi:hypothetical protein